MLWKKYLIFILVLGINEIPSRANLLVDGDFSVGSGLGTGSGSVTSQGSGSYQYDVNSGSVSGVGGTGGWTLTNGEANTGVTQSGSAIYVDNTASNPNGWIPNASSGNTNQYVIQLDTISSLASWTTGNAISQTLTTVLGQDYQITFYINTETGSGKGNLSGADLIITNSTVTNTGGATGTVLVGSTTDRNAYYYGNTTGYEYTVNTSSLSNGSTSTTWQGYTVNFTATSTSSLISFADDPISTNSNIALETISVVTVPEPRTWTIFILLGGLALMCGRRFWLQAA